MSAHYMVKIIGVVVLGAIMAATAFSSTETDDSLIQSYQKVLLEDQSGAHIIELSAERRAEFLAEPPIRTLLNEYKKSMRRTGHPAKPSARASFNAFMRLYEQHLVEVALRAERAQLNEMIAASFEESPTEFDLEKAHMKQLGQLYDRFTLLAFEGFVAKDLLRAQDYGALAYYIVTEAYVRLALYNMGYQKGLSALEKMASVLTSDNTEQLETTFWTTAHQNSNIKSYDFSMVSLKKFTGLDIAELVTRYQTIFVEDRCLELLSPGHPGSEG